MSSAITVNLVGVGALTPTGAGGAFGVLAVTVQHLIGFWNFH
jgi:hypothetical protein